MHVDMKCELFHSVLEPGQVANGFEQSVLSLVPMRLTIIRSSLGV